MLRRPRRVLLIALFFVAAPILVASASASAGTLGPHRVLLPLVMNGFQPKITLAASADAFISEGFPGQNYGTDPSLLTGNNDMIPPEPNTGALRSLVRFDLPAVGAQKVTRATLRIYLLQSYDVESAPPRTVTVHAATEPWEEATVTWDAPPGQSADEYGSFSISWNDLPDYRDIDVTALVTHWYDRSLANNGLYLVGPVASGSDASVQEFASREWTWGSLSHPPELILTF